jgi:hypothetical protein
MGTNVPQRPERAPLAPLRVGQPVRLGHGGHWLESLAFLLAGRVQPIASHVFPARAVSGTATYHVAYKRSAGAQLILCELEIPEIDDPAGQCTVAVACTTGTVSVVDPSSDSPLNGTRVMPGEDDVVLRHAIYRGLIKVTSLAVNTIHDLVFTVAVVTSTSTVYPRSLYRLHVVEVPPADADPVGAPSTEVGLDAAWPMTLNRLESGTTGTARGFVRLFGQLDAARAQVHHHWQLCCDETGLDATSKTFDGASAGVATTAGVLTVIDGPD